MQITWTCFMLLGDDIHDIFALINGKIVSSLVQNVQIISAYLLPHPPPNIEQKRLYAELTQPT